MQIRISPSAFQLLYWQGTAYLICKNLDTTLLFRSTGNPLTASPPTVNTLDLRSFEQPNWIGLFTGNSGYL